MEYEMLSKFAESFSGSGQNRLDSAIRNMDSILAEMRKVVTLCIREVEVTDEVEVVELSEVMRVSLEVDLAKKFAWRSEEQVGEEVRKWVAKCDPGGQHADKGDQVINKSDQVLNNSDQVIESSDQAISNSDQVIGNSEQAEDAKLDFNIISNEFVCQVKGCKETFASFFDLKGHFDMVHQGQGHPEVIITETSDKKPMDELDVVDRLSQLTSLHIEAVDGNAQTVEVTPEVKLESKDNIEDSNEDDSGSKSTRRSFICSYCCLHLPTNEALARHERVHMGPVHCKDCDFVGRNPHALKKHRRQAQHRTQGPIPCEECGEELATLALHKKHMETHNNETMYIENDGDYNPDQMEFEAPIVNYKEDDEDEWKEEAKIVKKKKKIKKDDGKPIRLTHVCNYCCLRLPTPEALVRHQRVHQGPIHCKDCDFVAKHPHDLKKHRRQMKHYHNRPKAEKKLQDPIPCEECGKVFATRTLHKQHMGTHATSNDSICELCGKGFKNKRYLMSHIKHSHSDETYLCTDCGKSFRQPSGYRTHRHLKHSDKPPERCQCEYCEKTFVTKTTMRLHQAIVHGKGSYLQCEQCPTKFVSESKMREHMQARHLGVKHPCLYCAKNFNHKFSLTKHLRDKKCPGMNKPVKEETANILPLPTHLQGHQEMHP